MKRKINFSASQQFRNYCINVDGKVAYLEFHDLRYLKNSLEKIIMGGRGNFSANYDGSNHIATYQDGIQLNFRLRNSLYWMGKDEHELRLKGTKTLTSINYNEAKDLLNLVKEELKQFNKGGGLARKILIEVKNEMEKSGVNYLVP